jgi:hypothetical protein
MTNQILDGYNGYAIEAEKKILQLECKVMEFVTLTQKLESENARLKALLVESLPIINEVLNQFYPLECEATKKECEARQGLFDYRNQLETQLKEMEII